MTVELGGEPRVAGDADDLRSETIPFNRRSIAGNEIDLIRATVERGHTSTSGPLSKTTSELLREAVEAEHSC